MNDRMIDLVAGDVRLRRRLEAFADQRLTPDLSATSRMRARVLAHAHRRANLARADAALTIVPPMPSARTVRRRHRGVRGTGVAVVAAAALVVAMFGGAAAWSGPGSALYDARLWLEAVTLPTDPSARAIAELDRLAERLREADAAVRRGDGQAAAAALAAYERIMTQASSAIVGARDPVASAAFEAGLGRNVEVLQTLIGQVPAQAGEAISRAIELAIERSSGTLDTVDGDGKPAPAAGGNDDGGGGTGGAGSQATPKPARTPTGRPEATPKPTKPSNEDSGTAKPTRTPRPTNDARPDDPRGNRPD